MGVESNDRSSANIRTIFGGRFDRPGRLPVSALTSVFTSTNKISDRKVFRIFISRTMQLNSGKLKSVPNKDPIQTGVSVDGKL